MGFIMPYPGFDRGGSVYLWVVAVRKCLPHPDNSRDFETWVCWKVVFPADLPHPLPPSPLLRPESLLGSYLCHWKGYQVQCICERFDSQWGSNKKAETSTKSLIRSHTPKPHTHTHTHTHTLTHSLTHSGRIKIHEACGAQPNVLTLKCGWTGPSKQGNTNQPRGEQQQQLNPFPRRPHQHLICRACCNTSAQLSSEDIENERNSAKGNCGCDVAQTWQWLEREGERQRDRETERQRETEWKERKKEANSAKYSEPPPRSAPAPSKHPVLLNRPVRVVVIDGALVTNDGVVTK